MRPRYRDPLVREVPKVAKYRSDLAYSFLRRGLARGDLGDPAGAAADARRAVALWEDLPSRTNEGWFQSACARAALAGLAGRAGSGVPAAEAVGEADVAMGYRSPALFRTEALDPLRRREDFQKLLAELEKKPSAQPE